jgi:hypothetical protein
MPANSAARREGAKLSTWLATVDRGKHGQISPLLNTSPDGGGVAIMLIMHRCLPPFRQQAGKLDSPEPAKAGKISNELNTIASMAAMLRRIHRRV